MIWQDIRYGARSLRARPALVIVAILSLALGVGANVAIFTVVNAVLLQPLPFADADRIVQLANGDSASTLSGPEVVDLNSGTRTLASVGAYAVTEGNVTGGRSDADRVRIARVSAGFFEVLRTPLAAGRPFTIEEDRSGAPKTVVVSSPLASRYFGDPTVAPGRTININDDVFTVTGVTRSGFEFPAATVDVWMPLGLDPAAPGERRNHQYRVLGRLAPDANIATAQAEIDAMKASWRTQYPATYNPKRPLVATVVTISDRVLGASRPYLLDLLVAVALVLLIACVNVASLLLTYGESRRHDLAICAAIGASRVRLATRTLSESALLAGSGGVAGLALAIPGYRSLVALAPASIPRLAGVALDWKVSAFAVAISVLAALVTAAVPLLRCFKDTDIALLRSAGRAGDAAGGRPSGRIHSALVIAEVALAVTLLGGAGLLTRSLLNLQRVDLGFSPDHVLTARLSLPHGKYDDVRAAAAVQAMVERLRQTRSVTHAAAMAWTPLVDGGGSWSVEPDRGVPLSTAAAPVAAPQQVTPDFFGTMGIPLLRGRDFTTADSASSSPVAIVNQAFGRLLWSDAAPIGRRFRMNSRTAKWVTIVGVAADTRVEGITEPKPPVMYFPHAQAGEGSYFVSYDMTLAVQHTGSAAPIAAAIRRIVREADPNVPVSDLSRLGEVVGSTIARERFTGALIGGFAGLAALLAGIGIYGVIAYGVTQRRFEIGLRMALGAAPAGILISVARRGLRLAAAGVVFGLFGAVVAGRLLRAVLFGVEPIDPGVLAVVTTVTIVIALTAVVAPARRAMRVNPTDALRARI